MNVKLWPVIVLTPLVRSGTVIKRPERQWRRYWLVVLSRRNNGAEESAAYAEARFNMASAQ